MDRATAEKEIATGTPRPPGARMRCEKYSADIPVATCLLRQKRANGTNRQWGRSGGESDPGCAGCAQGTAIAAARGVAAPESEEKVAVGEKTCTRCNESKPVDQFGSKPQMKDGLSYWCRPCTAENVRESYWKKRGKTPPAKKRGGGRPRKAAPTAAHADAARAAPVVESARVEGAIITITIDLSALVAELARMLGENLKTKGDAP